MSYGLAVAGDAQADLRLLESSLQEDVWDQLELLASDPSRLPSPSPDDDIAFEFFIDVGAVRHFFLMSLARNDSTRSLILLGVVHRQVDLNP